MASFRSTFVAILPEVKGPPEGRADRKLVAGTCSDQNLGSSQFEMVAGGRIHQNLGSQKSRPIGAVDLSDLASQVEMVAEVHSHLNLLFRAAA